jgi:predicted DNA-binding transcriptional regulator YafY
MKPISLKAKQYFDVLKFLSSVNRYVSAYDEDLLSITNLSSRRTQDILNGLKEYFGDSIDKKVIDKKFHYKLLKTENTILEILNKTNDLDYLWQYIKTPKLLKKLDEETKKRIKDLTKDDENIFLFITKPMEEIKNKKIRKLIDKLKVAIKNYEYRDIKTSIEYFKNVKPIKIIFTEENWYLAGVLENKELKFFRLSFIEDIKYSKKETYKRSAIKPYLEFLKTIQNPFTLYNTPKKKAVLKALPQISFYFDKNMKKFFSSQQFIKKENDSVIFSVEYTQPLEILPFIKKWIPNLVILKPDELKEELKKDIQKMLDIMTNNDDEFKKKGER